MLEAMTWEQLQEWHQYAQLEPFGEERDDLRSGIVAATIANSNRGKKTKPFKPADFMPKFDRSATKARSAKPRTAEQFRREFDQWVDRLKASGVRK